MEPSIEVVGRWDALLEPPARSALERALPAYIAARRWFRTKTRRVQYARIVAAFPLTFQFASYSASARGGVAEGGLGSEPAVARLALVELALEDGTKDVYVLPLAFVHGDEAARQRAERPSSVVVAMKVVSAIGDGDGVREGRGPRRGDVREGIVVDALALESFSSELLAHLARGTMVEDGGYVLRFRALADPSLASGARVRARLVDREQTNTSVLFGDRFVGKIVRKIDPGESADLEVGRFLTKVGYRNTPALVGWADVRPSAWPGLDDDKAPPASTVALVHAFVPNEGDAWEHALRVLGAWLTSSAGRDGAPPPMKGADVLSRAMDPTLSDVSAAAGPYFTLAETLGRRVGEMHVALASSRDDRAFSPEPLDQATRAGVVAAIRSDLTRALDVLGVRGPELSEPVRATLAAVRDRAKSIGARLTDIATLDEAGVKTRVHGDLHLGQILVSGADFVLIDFEGEPARPLEERKAKRSPLVDVAGMLRSFHYAAVSALRAQPDRIRAAAAPWAAFWNQAISAAFARGWLEAAAGSVVVPESRETLRALVELFLLEKVVYEVSYELNNRPDWVDIPLEGLREILSAPSRVERLRMEGSGEGARRGDLAAHGEVGSAVGSRGSSAADGAVHVAGNGARSAGASGAAGAGGGSAGGSGRSGHAGGPGAVAPSRVDVHSPAVLAFAQGKATHAHMLLGAHPHQDGGTDFAVWAPHAARVSVIGDFNGWSGEAPALARVGQTGLWAGRVQSARVGQRYKLRITTRAGETFDKSDPFAITSEVAPGNASIVGSLALAWHDGAWMEGRAQNARLDRPISIYEVHLGSWRRVVEEGGRSLSYREIAAPLATYVKQMGFTHVELMPLLEHPFYGSWGYGVTGFFAATSRYGTPTDLMHFVDTMHRAGIGVIFDWVPAHFARDASGLARFDGEPLFEPADTARAIHPTWNTGLFDFAKPEVRSFLLSSAMHWIETFHADGLRIDGVESMLYRDHGRSPGTWTPNEQGGRENLEGVAFLRELTSTLKIEHPEVLLAAEDSSSWPGVTRAASAGGLGFDLKWDMGFSHDVRRYLAVDPIHRSHHQGALTFRSVYAGNESFVIPLSHDDVIAERGGSLLEQMHGDPWQKLANLRILYALMYAQPGKKLLFMGNEIAQPQSWHHDRSLDWHLAETMPHSGIARMVGDLNHVYRELVALHAGDASPTGFEWIDGANAAMSVITFLRRGRRDDDVVLVAFNFTPVPRHQYRIGVPKGGHWREIFNSDARDYGGSGHGNLGGIDAVPYPWNGRASSVVVTLPPLGAIFLARS